jgi:hypothetical protein
VTYPFFVSVFGHGKAPRRIGEDLRGERIVKFFAKNSVAGVRSARERGKIRDVREIGNKQVAIKPPC